MEDPLPYAHNVSPSARKDEQFAQGRISISQEFVNAFSGAQHTIMNRARLRWMWPFRELFWDASAEYMRVVDSMLNPIVHEALRKYKQKEGSSQEKGKEEETLLEHLVKFSDGMSRFDMLHPSRRHVGTDIPCLRRRSKTSAR